MSEILMIECDVCHKRQTGKEVGATWDFRVEIVPHSAPHAWAQFHVCPDCRAGYMDAICTHLNQYTAVNMHRR